MDDVSETELARASDPMAKARAVKAEKAAQRARLELEQSERDAASAALAQGDLGVQPTKSALHSKSVLQPPQGELVRMKVTLWGDGFISTGGEFGYERFAAGAIFDCPEAAARQHFDKRYAEPLEPSFAKKWYLQAKREEAVSAKAYQQLQDVLEHGVSAGRDYSSHDSFGGRAP
jgi:hypothetical protein